MPGRHLRRSASEVLGRHPDESPRDHRQFLIPFAAGVAGSLLIVATMSAQAAGWL